jgi:hypothetical protein
MHSSSRQGHKAQLDLRDPRDYKVKRDLKVHKESKGRKESKDQLGREQEAD